MINEIMMRFEPAEKQDADADGAYRFALYVWRDGNVAADMLQVYVQTISTGAVKNKILYASGELFEYLKKCYDKGFREVAHEVAEVQSAFYDLGGGICSITFNSSSRLWQMIDAYADRVNNVFIGVGGEK